MPTRGRGPDLQAVRRERRIGNWGHASEHIGKRWEDVGLASLRPLLAGERPWPRQGAIPIGWLALSDDPELQSTLNRVGLPSPDVVVGLRSSQGELQLQAIDLKWHLEFASYKQISADTLRDLLAKAVPGLDEPLRAVIPGLDGQPAYKDGLFFAPDTPANHAFLAAPQNQRQEYPLERSDVLYGQVDGKEFFSVLPGWEMALLLAGFDRAAWSLENVEGAERYYRLGAGLQGAAAQLRSSVFLEEPLPVPAPEAFEWLLRTFNARPAGILAQEVDRAMAARSQLTNRLKELLRSPYRLSDLSVTLRQHGLPMPASIDEDTEYAGRCRELLRQVGLGHKAAVRRAGMDLVARGDSDAQALASLGRQPGRFLALAQAHADRLVDRLLPERGQSPS
ncbi:MAG: hypothetical protein M1401_09660 [Chloroflexi bacterium]|nr:hypothetical protein [Chloroflexota bacterium]MCL5109112.1 hypothetical protein [Chloroflexota bacterium]